MSSDARHACVLPLSVWSERWRDRCGLVLGLAVVAGAYAAAVLSGGRAFPLTAVLLGPLIASALAGPRVVGVVGLAACGAAVSGVLSAELAGSEAWTRLLLVLVASVGSAVTAALRLRRERALVGAERVAELSTALQHGLLPHIAGTPRVAVRCVYRPRSEGLVLGGDFIDAVPFPGAGSGAVAFCVGDVTGHDPVAAGLGASLRAAWRALALSGGDPASWLRALDGFTRSEAPEDRLATVCVGVLDPSARRLLVASAGHPRPIVLSRRAEVVDVEAGPPLGLPADLGLSWSSEEFVLDRTAAVMLYTDGLVEGRRAPGSPHRYGEEALAAWLDSATATPSSIATADLDGLLVDVEAANGGPLPDDVAVVVLASAPADASADPVRRALPERCVDLPT